MSIRGRGGRGDEARARRRREITSGVGIVVALLCIGGMAYAVKGKVDPRALPIGDGKYSTTAPQRDYVYLCRANPGGGGSMVEGPWVNGDGTWDSTAKAEVDGSVSWPTAFVSITKSGNTRTITSNDLPTNHTTGNYPISPSDDAYGYDRNPSGIAASSRSWSLPADPVKGPPQCMGGEVGIAVNGVDMYNPLDALLRDAPVHEMQDHCDGHPNQNGYHYHSVPDCLYSGRSRKKPPIAVGFAFDGFPITSPFEDGRRLSNDDLDVCHGKTSKVKLDGKLTRTYHYVATREYPYAVGCFRGTEIAPGAPR